MPWRLLGTVILIALILLFVGLNLNNRCDISFWFSEGAIIRDVPVYFTAFSSFVLGLLCSVPFAVSLALKKRPKNKGKDQEQAGALPGKKKKGKAKETTDQALNDGSYGVD